MPSSKNALHIRLTESVVFLRTGDGTGRTRSGTQPYAPPAMVRGLLTLTIVKPTKISSIEVELTGKTSTAWPEGVGARRVEVNEDHKIHSQSYVFFKAGTHSNTAAHRRTLSVGPGVLVDHDDEHSDGSSVRRHDQVAGDDRGREPTRGRQRERLQRRLSADQTNFQTGYVHHYNEQMPTPPYSPAYSPLATPVRRSPAPSIISPSGYDDSPAHSMEEFRRALSEHARSPDHRARSASNSRHDLSSSSNVQSPGSEHSLSRRVSFDETPPEFVAGSSTERSQPQGHQQPQAFVPGPSRSALSRQPGSPSPHPHSHDDRGRKGKKMSIGMLLDAVKERVRSVSRAERDPASEGLGRDPGEEGTDRRDSSTKRGRTRERRDRTTLERVTEVLGLESEEEDESREGWKEFRKGIYTYPISFAIPPGSPPSLTCEFGSVIWKLKAFAHRPGTFAQKLIATKEVTVVACPSEDDTEDTESIIVERQWDTQMQYLIAISGRSFAIGGSIPFSITFVPWTKMKVFRLSIIIEERIDYYTDFKRLVRTDPLNRVVLLSIKDPQKDHPILPLSSDDIETFKGSALCSGVQNDEELSDVISNLMGPGPWTINKEVPLPKSCGELHFTNKNKKSNITISHTLKVIFRVQRGDDQEIDPQSGKRKLFDIVVQTPIHILSCLCSSDYTALPPYSESASSDSVSPSTQCRCGTTRLARVNDEIVPIVPVVELSSNSSARSQSASHFRQTSLMSLQSANTSEGNHSIITRQQSSSRPPMSRQRSAIDGSSQYERLVAGRESESGEAPPAYEEVTAH